MTVVLFIVVFMIGVALGCVLRGRFLNKRIQQLQNRLGQLTVDLTDARQELEYKEDAFSALVDNFNKVNAELSEMKKQLASAGMNS